MKLLTAMILAASLDSAIERIGRNGVQTVSMIKSLGDKQLAAETSDSILEAARRLTDLRELALDSGPPDTRAAYEAHKKFVSS